MSTPERTYLRLHREPNPLGSYVRPLERDSRHMAELISAGYAVGTGVVVDACNPQRSEDLRVVALDRGLDLVLDPRSVELATEGGTQRSGVLDLPWSSGRIDQPRDFSTSRIHRYAARLATAAIEFGVTAVLAPTHFLEGDLSPWFELDLALTRQLRLMLDKDAPERAIRIYYPVSSNLRSLRPTPVLRRLVDAATDLAADGALDAIWLRIHNFGTNSAGPVTLPRYIRLARVLHAAGVPIVAERTGTVGIPLMAFGAVAGIESGITHGERFNIRELKRPRLKKASGGLAPRVYLPALGVYLKRDVAITLFNTRGMKGRFGCQLACCPQGATDMLSEPRRHFLVTRSAEVRRLAAVPQSMRVEHYFDSWLRLASDRASQAAKIVSTLEPHRKRLDMWWATFADQVDRDLVTPPTMSPYLEMVSSKRAGVAKEG